MRLRFFAVPAGAVAVAWVIAAVPASAGTGTDGWGNAQNVPGLVALNTAGFASVESVSCPSAGNCAAGGYYQTKQDDFPFVADEVHGVWHKAIDVPGGYQPGVLGDTVQSVSCVSAGNCALAISDSVAAHLMVDSEVNGVWQEAILIPGITRLAVNGGSITSISCGAPGNCSVGGSYFDKAYNNHSFLASETGGVWGQAFSLPDVVAQSGVNDISCRSAGNCSAIGDSTTFPYPGDIFAVDEMHGKWQKPIVIPGIARLNIGDIGFDESISCAAPGDCGTGGTYTDKAKNLQAFVASEVNGTWHDAIQVPGTQGGGSAGGISCTKPGYCSAGGSLSAGEAFVTSQVNGKWQQAIELPGVSGLASAGLITCTSPGNCSVAGTYAHPNLDLFAFVADQVNGTWHSPQAVPGLTVLSHGLGAEPNSISCGAPCTCVMGGFYEIPPLSDQLQKTQGFVAARQ